MQLLVVVLAVVFLLICTVLFAYAGRANERRLLGLLNSRADDT